MDGGIGESALMGALISGGVGLATGKNPLTAALLGGLTGGAMSGITGALGTAGADTAQGAVQAADATSAAANAGITPLPDTSSLYWSPASDVSAVNTADITNTGATSMMESPSLGASNGYVPGSGTESTQTLGQYANAQSQTPAANLVQTADGRYIDPTAYGSTATQNVATKAAADAATKPQGILGSLKQTWNGLSMPEKVGVGIAGAYGINQLMKPPTMIDPNIGKSSYSGPKLHDLSPNFKGTDVPQPQPYYTASYAEGGIADLASGGQMAPQQANIDFMGGDMYPQSQQQRSFYATPTQMPTSAQQAMASYEPNTNPLTGQPTVGMAQGGVTGYAVGGAMGMNAQSPTNTNTTTVAAPVQMTSLPTNTDPNSFTARYAQNVGGQFKDPYENYLMTHGSGSDIPMLLNEYQSAGGKGTPEWASLAGTNFNALPQMSQSWNAAGANPVDYLHAWNSTTPTTNSAPKDYWANLNAYNTGASQWNPQQAIAAGNYDPSRFAAYNSGLPIEGSHDAWPSYMTSEASPSSPSGNAQGGIIGMAAGGIAGYAAGGTPDTGGQVYYDPAKGQYYTQSYENSPWGPLGANLGSMMGGMGGTPTRNYIGSGMPGAGGDFQATQVTPEVYQQPTYASQPTTTAVSSTIPSYSLADSLPLLQATNPGIAAMYAPKTEEVVKKAEGGVTGYSLGGYADGGIPHLLKGPGDGMSDSIPATIGSKQPARLATGEFVVPADVVSHLGNGSTDAGAKHLYAMMDKVRTARTGRKSQGKQINASNYLPA